VALVRISTKARSTDTRQRAFIRRTRILQRNQTWNRKKHHARNEGRDTVRGSRQRCAAHLRCRSGLNCSPATCPYWSRNVRIGKFEIAYAGTTRRTHAKEIDHQTELVRPLSIQWHEAFTRREAPSSQSTAFSKVIHFDPKRAGAHVL